MHEIYFVKQKQNKKKKEKETMKQNNPAYGKGEFAFKKMFHYLTIESILKNCIPKTYGSFCTSLPDKSREYTSGERNNLVRMFYFPDWVGD